MKIDSSALPIFFLVCVSVVIGALLILNLARGLPHTANCWHAGEQYSEGARVEFSTGVQTCKAGKWE